MTVYYIRRGSDRNVADYKEMIVDGLVAHYELETYPVQVVILPERLQALLGPILDDIAENVMRPLNVFNPDVELFGYPEDRSRWMVEPEAGDTRTITVTDQLVAEFTPDPPPAAMLIEKVKKPRKQIPMELCPRCGKMAQMTKKGYCKLCAMRKAKEAKNTPHPAATLMEKSVSPVVREREAQGVEIVFETTPVEMRQIKRHGAIRGKRLG